MAKRVWMTASLVPVLWACATTTPPRTPDEVREAVRKGGLGTSLETREIERPFSAVLEGIRSHADRCFNVKVTRSGQSGIPGNYAPTRSEVAYHSSTRKVAEGTGEMTVQQEASYFTNMPPGGAYMQVTDVEAIGPGKTRVTISGTTAIGDTVEPIFSWGRGQDVPCPKMK